MGRLGEVRRSAMLHQAAQAADALIRSVEDQRGK
jgi:hypothetical protein